LKRGRRLSNGAARRRGVGQGVEHDDMNVLVLGSRVIGAELSKDLCITFMNARFTGEERHRRRLEKIHSIEERYSLDSVTKEKIS